MRLGPEQQHDIPADVSTALAPEVRSRTRIEQLEADLRPAQHALPGGTVLVALDADERPLHREVEERLRLDGGQQARAALLRDVLERGDRARAPGAAERRDQQRIAERRPVRFEAYEFAHVHLLAAILALSMQEC